MTAILPKGNRLVDTRDVEIVEINQEIAKKAAQIQAGTALNLITGTVQ